MYVWDKAIMKPAPKSALTTPYKPNGNIIPPSSLLPSEYGMLGVLNVLKAADDSDGMAALSLGYQMNTLGLNLKLNGHNLFQSYGGPFSDQKSRTQDIECNVPVEYLTNAHLRKRLPPIKLKEMNEDLLFYLFYNCTEEAYQTMAAHELYMRDWRYHKVKRVWLARVISKHLDIHTDEEKNAYYVFDSKQWKKVVIEVIVDYKDLEQRPPAPKFTTIPIVSPSSPEKDAH